jgi:RNA polymerase sigma-70 factor (ECF subfamily)
MDVADFKEPTTQQDEYLKDTIEMSLAKLPSIQKSIVLLRDQEGYNYDEIGEMLNLNPSQVKVYLFRARQTVKNAVKEIY